MPSEDHRRLDSWKAIAAHLDRDVRTVMRWEKGSGMPVHRVPGARRGRSVFAYEDELDGWLENGLESGEGAPKTAAAGTSLVAILWSMSPFARRAALFAAVVAAGLVIIAISQALVADESTVDASATHRIESLETAGGVIVARDLDGQVAWTYPHPSGYVLNGKPAVALADVRGDDTQELLLAANAEDPHRPEFVEGTLFCFAPAGDIAWTLSMQDTPVFGAGAFSPPWYSQSFRVVRIDGETRIAWSVHHPTWWPSVLVLLDGNGVVVGRFVNSGWVLAVNVLRRPLGDRLLVSGISNSRGGAMLAVLDGGAVSGSSPEDPGSEYECRNCPAAKPLRYFVFPRTEVNVASGRPYNEAVRIDVTADGVDVVVREGAAESDAQWIYEFSTDLELLGVAPGDSYRSQHRLLWLEGKIDHAEDECPEAVPPPVRMWTPEGGWTELSVPRR